MRPLGITLIGFYQILRGVITLVLGVSILAFTGLVAKLTSLAAEGNAIENMLHKFGHAAALVVIVFGLIHMLAGYGLLQMQNWGRLLALLFSAIGLVAVLPRLMGTHVFSVVFCAINAAIILYLAMPPIKRLFHAEGRSLQAAA